MAHFGKLSVSILLALPLVMGGCVPKKGTASPEDYFPLIQVAMAGGETAAMIGRNEAIKAKNFGGCVAAASLITGFDGATQVLAGRIQGLIVIPAVEIDVSECLALREAAGDESASFHGPGVVITKVAGDAPEAAATPATEEKAVEEAAAATPAEAEAAPAEAGERAGAEELDELAEEVPEFKGNPEAAALVEAIGGITLAAVLFYASKLQTVNCKKGTAALGAINYVNGMIKPVADEIAKPDGKVSVPAVTIDLSGCAEG